jgi:hypothetical protein
MIRAPWRMTAQMSASEARKRAASGGVSSRLYWLSLSTSKKAFWCSWVRWLQATAQDG